MVQLYDIGSKENDDILRDFYYMKNIERDISLDFKSILNLVKDALQNYKIRKINKDGIKKLFDTLKTFDKNLITLSEEEFKLLNLDNENNDNNNENNLQDESQLNKSNITTSTNIDNNLEIIDLLYSNDSFNNFGINDINYIISQEISQEEKTKSIIIPYKHSELQLNKNIKKK